METLYEIYPNSWPWQISLKVAVRGKLYHIYGGSLILSIHVVTAAHCVVKNATPSRYKIVVGKHHRTRWIKLRELFFTHCHHLCPEMQAINIDARPVLISHSKFSFKSKHNNKKKGKELYLSV